MKRLFFVLVILMVVCPLPSRSENSIPVAVLQETYKEYERIYSQTGTRPCLLNDFRGLEITRTLADVIIAQKAIRLGGINSDFVYEIVPNSRRATANAANGLVALYAHQLNLHTLDVPGYKESFMISDPVTRYGEFQKGFYCMPDNVELLSATTAEEINERGKGIVGQHWNNDKLVLGDMGITNVIDAPTFESMVRMVAAGRADWIPLEISNSKDFSMTVNGVRLVPIPGIKFSLLESRHFFVSRNHPEGEKIFSAMQIGIKKLRKQGFIRKILSQAGIFNPNTDSWIILNAREMKKGGE